MSLQNHEKIAELIKRDRDSLLASWRSQVRELDSAKDLDVPTLNDHIPKLLDELAAALCLPEVTISESLRSGSPPTHGIQRLRDGYDIEEVVAEYNILRDCVHDLAENNALIFHGRSSHILNRVFDTAIRLAVQSFATQQALEVQHRREEYLTFVAHDLRTPLNAISLSARVLEMILPRQDEGGEASQMLKTLQRNVQHLDSLIRKILEENANLQTEIGVKLQRRNFDLWPLVESLTHDLHPVAGTASVKLLNKIPDELVVYADAGLLTRVFQNLIANAIKYTPHGQITIGAEELGEDGGVECWVSDNGAGIPQELLDKIFDKGETDPNNDSGLGLGLAIVKTFTEAHGGNVSVESREAVGTTFRFFLPARSESGK